MAKDAPVQKDDISLMRWQDVPAAIGLLTRLPIRIDPDRAQARGAAAAWAYPIAGAVLGSLLVLVATVALAIGLPISVTAALLLLTSVVVTGAMHEDGVADSADGLWGGWTRERRLEIMKDSTIGAYGVLALGISLLLRWACLTALLGTESWAGALLCVAMLSRAAMVTVMTGLPFARADGLSRSVGRPRSVVAWLAIGIATFGAFLAVGLDAGTLIIVLAVAVSLCAGIAHRKIGGQTGDILGATQQVCEIALLMTFTVI